MLRFFSFACINKKPAIAGYNKADRDQMNPAGFSSPLTHQKLCHFVAFISSK